MNQSLGRRILKWTAWSLTGIVATAALVIYIGSELVLRRTYPDVNGHPVALPQDSRSLSEGKRLARVYGCGPGCHGAQSEGEVLFDEPVVARLVAPNLTRAIPRYTDTELERIIRHGVRPTGRSLMVMPSQSLAGLSDSSLAMILAYLRTLPTLEGPGPSLALGPLGRLGLVTGQFKTAVMLIPPDAPPPPAVPPTESIALGRYLAHTVCAECHGTDLEGDPTMKSVNLAVVSGYSPAEFARLLQSGVPKGERKLGLMGDAARGRFVALTPTEVAALYAYLHSRSGQS